MSRRTITIQITLDLRAVALLSMVFLLLGFMVAPTIARAFPRGDDPEPQAYDAQNADKVDGHHAGSASGTKAQRANRVLWANKQGQLHWRAMPQGTLNSRYVQRTKDTFHYVPGGEAFLDTDYVGQAELRYYGRGMVRVRKTGSAGDIAVYIPISLPAYQNGRWVKVENIQVYYELDNASSYIDVTHLFKLNAADGSFFFLIDDDTHRTSTSWTSYPVNCSAASCALSSPTGGFLTFGVILHFAGTGEDHDIFVGGVMVRVSYQ